MNTQLGVKFQGKGTEYLINFGLYIPNFALL